jgi:hypothetical protein
MMLDARSARLLSSALAMALAASACSDAAGPEPRLLTDEETESIGFAVQAMVSSSIGSMTSDGAVSTSGGALGLARHQGAIALDPLGADCPAPSQDPIVDSDGDDVPDDVTFTFALPACHFGDGGPGTVDVTGTLRVVDPSPQTAAHAFDATLTSLRLAFTGQTESGSITQTGHLAVSAAAGGLAQSHTMTWVAEVTGQPTTTITSSWNVTFAPAEGASLVLGQALPDGAFNPSGSMSWSHGSEQLTMAVEAPTPLQYDASCASSGSPFSAGELRVLFSTTDVRGFVRLTYADCADPQVVFVAAR